MLAQAFVLVVVERERGDGCVPVAASERDFERSFARPDVRTAERPLEVLAGQSAPAPAKLTARLSRDARLIAFEQRGEERGKQVEGRKPAESANRSAPNRRRLSGIEERNDAIHVRLGAGLPRPSTATRPGSRLR